MANEVEIHVRVQDDTGAGARSARKSGEKTGKEFGDGVAEGVKKSSGKQREAFGQWTKQSEDDAGGSGERSGRNFGERFGAGLRKAFGGKDFDAAGVGGKVLGSLKSTLGAGQPLAITLGTAFSAQFVGSLAAGLASGAAKVAHGLGASLALLPAIIGTAV